MIRSLEMEGSMRVVLGLFLSFAIVLSSPGGSAAAEIPDKVIPVETADPELNAAIAEARATLDEFWRQHAKPEAGVDYLALKVGIADDQGRTEHFWLNKIERKGAKLSGIIDNEPNWVTTVAQGDRYAFKEAD